MLCWIKYSNIEYSNIKEQTLEDDNLNNEILLFAGLQLTLELEFVLREHHFKKRDRGG